MAKYVIICFSFSVENDKPLFDKVCRAKSASSYIKSLIAKDISVDYPVEVTFLSSPKAIPASGNISISINPNAEKEILEKLNSVSNKSDYIRSLVYDDMNSTKSKSFSQLSDEIDLDEYTDMAQFTAARFAELADIMRSNGFLAKASECTRLVDMLNNWAMNVK